MGWKTKRTGKELDATKRGILVADLDATAEGRLAKDIFLEDRSSALGTTAFLL